MTVEEREMLRSYITNHNNTIDRFVVIYMDGSTECVYKEDIMAELERYENIMSVSIFIKHDKQ